MDIQWSEIPLKSDEKSEFHLTVLLLPMLIEGFVESSMNQTQTVKPHYFPFSIVQAV